MATLEQFESYSGRPHPLLAGVVSGYTGFVHGGGTVSRRREVAQDQVTVILLFGPPLVVGGPGTTARPYRSFVAPLADTFAVTEEYGSLAGIQIDLSPLGAFRVFGVPLSGIVAALEDLLGRESALLEESLFSAPGWPDRFTLLDLWLLRRLSVAPEPSPDLAWAWSLLAGSGGTLRIGSVAATIGCSRRHLEVCFRDAVGVSPKTVARVLRFQRAVRLLAGDDGRRFAEIAATIGFYDQAHMNREFLDLAGVSPGTFIGARLPGGGIAA